MSGRGGAVRSGLVPRWNLYKTSPRDLRGKLCDKTFDGFAGVGKACIGPLTFERDLRKLEEAARHLVRLANKRVAHAASPRSLRRLPTYRELDEAITVLDELAVKYHLLLTASSMVGKTMEPKRAYEWRQALAFPWWTPPQSLLREGACPPITRPQDHGRRRAARTYRGRAGGGPRR
jgi:hypothetical protein